MSESVISLYSKEETGRAERRERRLKRACVIIAAAALTACIILCVLVNTATEHLFRPLAVGISALCGSVCVCLYMLGVKPARALSTHAEGLEKEEKEEYEGVLLPGREYFSIPRSVTVCRIRLQGEKEEILRLSLRADREKLLPVPGTRIKAVTARKYILSLEITENGANASGRTEDEDTSAENENGRRKQAGREARAKRRKKLRRLFSPLPAAVLCILLSALFWGWVMDLRTDTTRDRKITLYTTAAVTDQTGLSVRMEEWAKAGHADRIRMAQAREFKYFMFGGNNLEAGDLFIIRESEFGDYSSWFAPLPEAFRDLPGAVYISENGTPFGIRVYTPDGENGILPQYISFGGEDWYLFFGNKSLHLNGNEGAVDHFAADAAKHLLDTDREAGNTEKTP